MKCEWWATEWGCKEKVKWLVTYIDKEDNFTPGQQHVCDECLRLCLLDNGSINIVQAFKDE